MINSSVVWVVIYVTIFTIRVKWIGDVLVYFDFAEFLFCGSLLWLFCGSFAVLPCLVYWLLMVSGCC